MTKKRRQARVVFRPRQSVSGPITFRFSTGGGIELVGDNGPIAVDVSSAHIGYERKKGFKTISQMPGENLFSFQHPDVHLSTYDHFFVVDTNTITIMGCKVSATCAMNGRCEIITGDSGEAWFIPAEYYEFRNLGEKPEIIAWWFLIGGLLQDPTFSQQKRYAIIVDSELGSLEDMNYRRKPIFKQDYLPSNCRRLYASSDAGKEYALNRLF